MIETTIHTTRSAAETEAYAREFLNTLTPQKTAATVVGLYGNLGAGKTAFTKGIARALNVAEEITSPTFVIEKIYKLTDASFSRLIHIDAYRLERGAELAHLGWHDLLSDPANLIFIEWPEKVAEVMPPKHHEVHFTFIDEHTRTIERK